MGGEGFSLKAPLGFATVLPSTVPRRRCFYVLEKKNENENARNLTVIVMFCLWDV